MARGQHTIVIPSGDASGTGKRILIAPTSNGAAIEVHESLPTTTGGAYRYFDFITITAYNLDTVTRRIYLLWGGTTEPNDLITVDVPPGVPPVLVIDADPLTGGAILKAYASVANVISLGVRVDRFQQA